MKKLNSKGVTFFSIMLFIGLLLATEDNANIWLFIMWKAIAVALILVSGEFLINNIDK